MKLFVESLTVLDFSYLHPRRGLVGESWQLDLVLTGALDDQGMVLDFGEVKKRLKALVDDRFDHRLLVPLADPGLAMEGDTLTYRPPTGLFVRHRGPAEALCLLDAEAVTPATTATAIVAALEPELPANVAQVEVTLHPEPEAGPCYHYSHGLKRHCGNCQRIAHGHRSRIEIERDGRRDPDLEAQWARRFTDIYLACEDDLEAITRQLDRTCYRFTYDAGQGAFELEITADRCYLLETETTVENIARHIRERLEAENPGASFRVKAYEGIGKGAISESRAMQA